MISSNKITNYPASTMDYLPTFLDVVGLQHPQPTWPVDGASLMPFIFGEESARKTPIGHIFTQDGEWAKGASSPWDAWSHNAASGGKVSPVSAPNGRSEPSAEVADQARQVSWRVDNLKLYGWRATNADKWQYALFDIANDAGENNNIANQNVDDFTSMYDHLWSWATTVRKSQESETTCLKKSEFLV